jgi:hypothetical protein
MYTDRYPNLAYLALRIFETIANSVALERAFSAMNLNYSKLRNQLSPVKAAKIVYIYINQRALNSIRDRLWVNDEN